MVSINHSFYSLWIVTQHISKRPYWKDTRYLKSVRSVYTGKASLPTRNSCARGLWTQQVPGWWNPLTHSTITWTAQSETLTYSWTPSGNNTNGAKMKLSEYQDLRNILETTLVTMIMITGMDKSCNSNITIPYFITFIDKWVLLAEHSSLQISDYFVISKNFITLLIGELGHQRPMRSTIL